MGATEYRYSPKDDAEGAALGQAAVLGQGKQYDIHVGFAKEAPDVDAQGIALLLCSLPLLCSLLLSVHTSLLAPLCSLLLSSSSPLPLLLPSHPALP